MDELGYWQCGVGRSTARHRYYLCEIGDWTWDYGESSGDGLVVVFVNLAKVGDGLVVVANPAFAAILAGTGAVARVRVVPDSAITPLTKRLQPCAVTSISATIRAKTLFKLALNTESKNYNSSML